MLIEGYLKSLFDAVAASPIVRSSDVEVDRRGSRAALVRSDLFFADGSRLHFREQIEAKAEIIRRVYSFHYQDAGERLIFRYDDTPHHLGLSTSPHHKHDAAEANVIASAAPDLQQVLMEIEGIHPLLI